MKKQEYDRLIEEEYICRIAFKGENHPYIAPFLYIFDGKFMYFLSTKYGRKVQYFKKDPYVTVEVEKYTPDLSNFAFVSIPGCLEEVQDPEIRNIVRQKFVDMIKKRNLLPITSSIFLHLIRNKKGSLIGNGCAHEQAKEGMSHRNSGKHANCHADE